ncbi:MAG TPA: hypothetical protein VJB08_05875 [Candidatus Nanoarchaeia archaeon]|nr:hypothetical protein [Candidatus Nanoarchaeia archaeon]
MQPVKAAFDAVKRDIIELRERDARRDASLQRAFSGIKKDVKDLGKRIEEVQKTVSDSVLREYPSDEQMQWIQDMEKKRRGTEASLKDFKASLEKDLAGVWEEVRARKAAPDTARIEAIEKSLRNRSPDTARIEAIEKAMKSQKAIEAGINEFKSSTENEFKVIWDQLAKQSEAKKREKVSKPDESILRRIEDVEKSIKDEEADIQDTRAQARAAEKAIEALGKRLDSKSIAKIEPASKKSRRPSAGSNAAKPEGKGLFSKMIDFFAEEE